MKQAAAQPEYHPRWYRARVPTFWWLKRRSDRKFMLREISSVFVAWFVIMLMLQMRALTQGPEAYQEFQEWLRTPTLIALNGISFCFVLLHAITWFNLAAKAMVVRLGGRRLPDLVITGGNYLAWVVASAGVAWLLLGV